MPQFMLTDGELVKKTLRTTLIMVGGTFVWLGMLSGAVILSTGAVSADAADSKSESAAHGATGTATIPGAPGGPVKGAAVKSGRRPAVGAPKADTPHAGDPI
jgi:hypothetical protein